MKKKLPYGISDYKTIAENNKCHFKQTIKP